MRRLVFSLTVVMLAWPSLAVSASDSPSIDSFIGSWSGRILASGTGTPPKDALSLDVRENAGGFRMSWPDLSGSSEGNLSLESASADFSPTERAGVYDVIPKQGSLLTRMFASPATGNPLRGETLLWARLGDQTLAIYKMKIDMNGGFKMDHYSWTRDGAGLQFVFSRRTEDLGVEMELEGELLAKGD